MNYKPAHLSIIAAIILALFAAWYLLSTPQQKPETPAPERKVVTPVVSMALPNKLAENFPKNIPLNAKTKLVQSYSATYPNSPVLQATVVFESSKSAAANYDFYLKWARDNSWQVVRATKSASEGFPPFLYFKKGNEIVSITIKAATVTISYVNLKK